MKRIQTVSYAPGYDTNKPMIRLANNFLLKHGFHIGNKIEIRYSNEIITITLKKQDYDNTKPMA